MLSLAAAVCLACLAAPCSAEAASGGEYQIKAAFLYKFLGFVDWPPAAFDAPTSSLVIGVLGADALADELLGLVAGRLANGRSVSVRRLSGTESLTGLHVLFVGRAASARLGPLVTQVSGWPLLIVSESEEAFALGSAINFVVMDNKVRFDVALRRSEQAGLKISARLLAVARHVSPGVQ